MNWERVAPALRAAGAGHDLRMGLEVGADGKSRYRAGCRCGWSAEEAFGLEVECPGGDAEETFLEHVGGVVMDGVPLRPARAAHVEPVCVECERSVDEEYRRVCCGCGRLLHDDCWIEMLTAGRLEPSGDGQCSCGGGWNLAAWNEQLTACADAESDGPSDEPGCRCEA